jgi:hypothetical protein
MVVTCFLCPLSNGGKKYLPSLQFLPKVWALLYTSFQGLGVDGEGGIVSSGDDLDRDDDGK